MSFVSWLTKMVLESQVRDLVSFNLEFVKYLAKGAIPCNQLADLPSCMFGSFASLFPSVFVRVNALQPVT